MSSIHRSVFTRRLLVLTLASLARTAAAAGGSTTGVVEPAIVFIEADPSDSAKFEEYRDVPEGLVLPHLHLEWNANSELFQGGMFVELDAIDVSQQDQRIALGFGSRGLWKGTLNYKENPHRFGDGMKQLYTYQGDGVFTLPDTLQAAIQAAPASADANADLAWDAGTKGAILRDALAGAPDVTVAYQRKTGSVGFEFTPTRDWRFGFEAQRERRNGPRPHAGGSNPRPTERAQRPNNGMRAMEAGMELVLDILEKEPARRRVRPGGDRVGGVGMRGHETLRPHDPVVGRGEAHLGQQRRLDPVRRGDTCIIGLAHRPELAFQPRGPGRHEAQRSPRPVRRQADDQQRVIVGAAAVIVQAAEFGGDGAGKQLRMERGTAVPGEADDV